MTLIDAFHLASAVGGVVVAALMVVKLAAFPDSFKLIERVGMGLVGSMMILRISPILAYPETTPFSDWSTCVLTIGLIFMHWGRLKRLIKHSRDNTRALDAAEKHLKARGKI